MDGQIKDGQAHSQKDKHVASQTKGQVHRRMDGQTQDGQADILKDKHIDRRRNTHRLTDKQADRQIGRQKG
jgi:hypothetical protein